ncbi:MAG: hypothetical protein ABIV47_20925 [Roseiflexaceae bacterium]
MIRQLRAQTFVAVLGIAATPLCLAVMGLTHPHELTPETASYWYMLHYILLPIFPLLGLNIWWLLATIPGAWAWLARMLAFLYIPFYGALDVFAGMGTGLVMSRAHATGQTGLTTVNTWLFAQGNELAEVGVWAFLLACVLTSLLLIRRIGRPALPGALLLCVAAVSFLSSHIYYPVGVLTMLVMGSGFAWLQWSRLCWVAPPA